MPPKTSSTKTAKNVDSSSQLSEEEVDVIQSFSPAENLLFSANQFTQLVEMVRLAVDQIIDSKIDKSIEKILISYNFIKYESAYFPPAGPTVQQIFQEPFLSFVSRPIIGQNGAFRPKDLRYFDPPLFLSANTPAAEAVGDVFIYRDVSQFVDRIKEVDSYKTEVVPILPACFRGAALQW